MRGIPSDVGDAIDNSLCDYEGYFPDIMCVLHTCQNVALRNIRSIWRVLMQQNLMIKPRGFL